MIVNFTNEAILENEKNIEYLTDVWGISVTKNYVSELKKTIEYIENDILKGNFDTEIGLYKVLVVKQIYLFYDIQDSFINIIYVWNNHKKPFWL